jgi:hypothetical protein
MQLPKDLRELVDASSLIMVGSVTKNLPSRRHSNHPAADSVSDRLFAVEETKLGEAPISNEIIEQEYGGVFGDIEVKVHRSEPLVVGGRYLLFFGSLT